MRTLRTIVIDINNNEVHSFKNFEKENSALFNIIAYISNTENIIELINETKPDVLFIDIDSLSFKNINLNELKVSKPKLIFLSIKKSNAYKAYKTNAIDFLLKPLDLNSLIISIYKVIRFIDMEVAFQQQSLGEINKINQTERSSKYISIASVDKIDLLKVSEIMYCKADSKYTEFFTVNNGKIISSKNLGYFEDTLKINFFRVHHSYIVNLNYLNKIKKDKGIFCELTNGDLIPVSKRKQESFFKYINK